MREAFTSNPKIWSMHSGARYEEGVMQESYDGRLLSGGHPLMVSLDDYLALKSSVETKREHPYLLNATRFKLSFNRSGYTGALSNFASVLDGRWVALVAAEDDAHMRGYKPELPFCMHGFYPGNCSIDSCAHGKGTQKSEAPRAAFVSQDRFENDNGSDQ